MSRKSEAECQASASTSLYYKEHIELDHRQSSPGFPSLFKWFKKGERKNCKINGADRDEKSLLTTENNINITNGAYNCNDILTPPSSPILGYISTSSSCDSVLSTSTTGFAFISPNNYKPNENTISYNSSVSQLLNGNQDNFKPKQEANNIQLNFSLERKYNLYDFTAVESTELLRGEYDNVKFIDRSLPYFKSENNKNSSNKTHRRTASDGSNNKSNDIYVHVKGKRKAPPPPVQFLNNATTNEYENISKSIFKEVPKTGIIYSTIGRKKRRAPAPPSLFSTYKREEPIQSILSEGLFNETEIRAIMGDSSALRTRFFESNIRTDDTPQSPRKLSEHNAAQKLTEDQKQALIDNIVKSHMSTANKSESKNAINKRTTHTHNIPIDGNIGATPASPRPWYKRPLSSNRDSAIPFKREVVLKTMEKRKNKQKDKDTKSKFFPEVSRSSIFDTGHKFNFFLRNKDNEVNKLKDKEKRRSAIGIPNISELDREAAEIIYKENFVSERNSILTEHLILQQKMFTDKCNQSLNFDESLKECDDKINSTKELICKFEANMSIPRITINPAYINNKETHNSENPLPINNFSNDGLTNSKNDVLPDLNNKENIFNLSKIRGINERDTEAPVTTNSNFDAISIAITNDNEKTITHINWCCPFCTLENPNWKIICEACERIKPYDKKLNITLKNDTIGQFGDDIRKLNFKYIDGQKNVQNNENVDWDKKTEKVLKYFPPATRNNALTKSSSETIIGLNQSVNKLSHLPTNIVMNSPNLKLHATQSKSEQSDLSKIKDLSDGSTKEILAKGNNYLYNNCKVVESSPLITSVIPVFDGEQKVTKYTNMSKSIMHGIDTVNINEVRNARLLKFDNPISSDQVTLDPISQLIDRSERDSLEKEKKRLREMIRAMNAKALAEKYPIKETNQHMPSTFNDTNKNLLSSSMTNYKFEATKKNNTEANKLGAIKKIFTKNNYVGDRHNEDIYILNKSKVTDSKPKKVSTSVQTSGVIKKIEDIEKQPTYADGEEINPPDLDSQKSKYERNGYMHDKYIKESTLDDYNLNHFTKLAVSDNVKLHQISQQLKSMDGISHFKDSLNVPDWGMSQTDTIALNKIMRNLEIAIVEGKDELAARIAVNLAKMKVALHVTKQKKIPPCENGSSEIIIVDIFVEDKISRKGPIQITITPLMTIKELKQKIFVDFGIPMEIQKWFVDNTMIIDDNKTLKQCGLNERTSKIELYLAEITSIFEKKRNNIQIPSTSIAVQEDMDDDDVKSSGSSNSHNDLEENYNIGAIALPLPITNTKEDQCDWTCPLCTLINRFDRLDCIACSTKKPQIYNINTKTTSSDLNALNGNRIENVYAPLLRQNDIKNDLNKENPKRKSSETFNIITPNGPSTTFDFIHDDITSQNFSNSNIAKYKYRGVDNFNPNRKIIHSQATESKRNDTKFSEMRIRKNPAPPIPGVRKSHYLELLSLDNTDLVLNVDDFDCPICFACYQGGEGVVLRDCLHTFCKDCLLNTIRYSEDAEVICPYIDTEYSCESVLQEREIKSLVPKNIYELHLAKSVRVAENQIENAFHCKTPNCRGWCIYEDNVNQFKCPVCKITNCLTCRVIHDGLTCKQYQDRLTSDCDSNIEARRTKDMLREMVEKGEAMNCPTCQVIMMKKWGCDWLKCSMCKTEICWVTRGARWGPGGKGDTSGGCKCGVDGKKCHPKCNYCH